jgi:hypothetical protein
VNPTACASSCDKEEYDTRVAKKNEAEAEFAQAQASVNSLIGKTIAQPGDRDRLHHFPFAGAPALSGHRPPQSRDAGPAAQLDLRHPAGLLGVGLRERLQLSEPRLPGQHPGDNAFRLGPESIRRLYTRNENNRIQMGKFRSTIGARFLPTMV